MNDNLPPLPEPDTLDRGWELSAYSEEQMQAYARAAIERQSVPAGWMLVPIEPSDEWIARLESQQTGGLESVDADAIRQCIVELLAAAPHPQPVRCTYCDGTGDVHSITGEWRGACCCEAGKAPQPQPVQEPVATVQCIHGVTIGYLEVMQPVGTKLYTSPQAQPLSNEQITKLPVWRHFVGLMPEHHVEITRAIEQAHGITKGTT